MKQTRLAIIGCGGYVRNHVKYFAEKLPQIKCVGLCDIVRDHATKLRDDLLPGTDPAIYLDYRDLLKEVKPDAVIVSTPHTLHFQHAYDSISAGAHVMVDKPMVTNSTDARTIVRHAASRKKLLSIAIQGIHTDTFAYARKLVKDGTMGPLQLVTAFFGQNWMKGTVGLWRQDPKLSGGGQLYDSMCHVFSSMLYLVNSPPVEVFCFSDYMGCKVDINSVCVIKFANGCMATATAGGNCAGWRSHLHVQGENAMMDISPHGGDFRVSSKSKTWKNDLLAVPDGWKIPTVKPVENFASAIAGKSDLRVSGELGILLADLMDGLYASIATGLPVRMVRRGGNAFARPKFMVAGSKKPYVPASGRK